MHNEDEYFYNEDEIMNNKQLEQIGNTVNSVDEHDVAQSIIINEITRNANPCVKPQETEDATIIQSKKKIKRFSKITGEPTKEFKCANKSTWKIKKMKQDNQKRGIEILEKAEFLDQYIIEAFTYSKCDFDLPYKKKKNDKYKIDIFASSFQEDLARRWCEAHPRERIEYLDEYNYIQTYNPFVTDINSLPWKKPMDWFLDMSNLVEDDRFCILQILFDSTMNPYKIIMDSIFLKK